jgi:Ni/Co efflux regulator RcnB
MRETDMIKRLTTAAAAAVLGLASISGAALAQPYGHDHGPPGHDRIDDRGGPPGQARFDDRGGPRGHANGHHNWRRGDRIGRNDWNRYERVDWRRHHLRAPPRGYEWREVDGNYVLAAAATGLIASIIAASQ